MNWIKYLIVSSSLFLLGAGSCAALNIKTWYLDGSEEQGLIRRNTDGSIREKLSFLQAQGYLCYSPSDDQAWRERMNLCCNQSTHSY